MKETEISINHDGVVGRKLGAILSPWANVPKAELPGLIEAVSVPVVELASRAGVSPQKVLEEVPSRVELNGQDFKVVRSSKNGHHSDGTEQRDAVTNLRIKKLIRESVKEPPIRGVRNGGMRLDEKILKRKIGQARIERERLVFQAIEPFDKDKARIERRTAIQARLAQRFARKSESGGLSTESVSVITPDINEFRPDLIVIQERDGRIEVASPAMVSIDTALDDCLSLIHTEGIFPTMRNVENGTTEERIEAFLNPFSTKDANTLSKDIAIRAERGEQISFGMMCLPCLNPNPFITDHEHLAVNVPTVLFLRRLEHIASGLQSILGVPVVFNIAREFEHMSKIFPMTDSQRIDGVEELSQLIDQNYMTHVNIVSFCSGDIRDGEPRPEEINKFLPAFRRSQFSPTTHPVATMFWLGTINERDAIVASRRNKIDLAKEMEIVDSLKENAFHQAKTWAKLREAPWQSTPEMQDSIIVSVRPGSRNFTFVPITTNCSEDMPMLQQHCSLGIDEHGQIVTMKRIDFLVKPNRWLEAKTEFGAIFIDRRLI